MTALLTGTRIGLRVLDAERLSSSWMTQIVIHARTELRQRAELALASLSNAHASAVAHATHPDNVARSKIRGNSATTKSVPRIQVKLSKALNANAARAAEKNSNFTPTLMDWPENASCADVLEALAASLDFHYLKKYDARVTSADISLLYANSGTAINDAHMTGTLAWLWRNSSGITVSQKDRRNCVLDVHAIVQYPRKVAQDFASDDDSDLYSDVYSSSGKRKASGSILRSSKRFALAPAGAGAYRTSVQIDEQQYTRPLHVSIRRANSASGATKKMYILTLDRVRYAAKAFFDIGGRAPTLEENLQHLRNELVCQKHAGHCLTRFKSRTAEAKISIADLSVAESFILHVVEGPMKHQAWIVDPLLSTFETVKFSGTDVAGSHGDLFGSTCDALAHFSLEDSEAHLVFVDIQGIKEP
ncbi:hypothetical protein B0H15DRAFT_931486, partial [Mycena belliarum]